jgi:hypothetical protein
MQTREFFSIEKHSVEIEERDDGLYFKADFMLDDDKLV